MDPNRMTQIQRRHLSDRISSACRSLELALKRKLGHGRYDERYDRARRRYVTDAPKEILAARALVERFETRERKRDEQIELRVRDEVRDFRRHAEEALNFTDPKKALAAVKKIEARIVRLTKGTKPGDDE